MIYQYIYILIAYALIVYFYIKYRALMPMNLRRLLVPVLVFSLVIVFMTIGTPVRMESTSVSGKKLFNAEFKSYEKVSIKDRDPSELIKQGLDELKNQSKEKKNEINN